MPWHEKHSEVRDVALESGALSNTGYNRTQPRAVELEGRQKVTPRQDRGCALSVFKEPLEEFLSNNNFSYVN